MDKKLFNKDFTLLWLGQTVSQLGNGAGVIGLLWWVQVNTGSALALGTLAMIQTLISVGIGPFAGALVDRLDRKFIIVITDFIRGINYCVLAWLAATNQLSLPIVFALAGFNSVCSQFFGPAISASIPRLVPNERLEQANSLNQVSVSLVNILGYAAGGILVALLGVPALLLANGISFVISAFSELFIHIPPVHKDKQKLTARLFAADLKEGLAYVMGNKVLFRVMQVAMVLNLFSAPIFILLPKFVAEHLGADSAVFGYLLSAQMAGALLAMLLMSATPLVRKNLWLVRWGLVLAGLLTISLILLPRELVYLHVAVFGLLGVVNSVVNVYFGTVLQRATRPEHMGKVFGLLTTMSQGLQPLSQGLSGLAADFIRLPIIYGICGGFVSLGGTQFGLLPGIMGFLKGEAMPQEEVSPQADPAVA